MNTSPRVLRDSGGRMMNKTGLKALLLLCLVLSALAGWERTYGGSNFEYSYSVAQTADGGFIIVGSTGFYINPDVYLVKTDNDGNTLWTRTYGGSYWDEGYSVIQTTDGGYIIACLLGSPSCDIVLMKTNSSGDTLWTRNYGRCSIDFRPSVAQTNDGGYIIAGHTSSYTTGSFYIVKTDSFGDTLWTRAWGGHYFASANSVEQTLDDGFIIVGSITPFGTSHTKVYLVKTDSSGDTLWSRTFGGTESDAGYSLAQTTDGGFVITGYTESFGTDSSNIYIIRTDSLGDTLWTRVYGGSGKEYSFSVAQTADGGFIIGGWTSSYGAGYYDIFLVKTDPSGDTMWTRTYGGSYDDRGYSVRQTSDGGFIIAGRTNSFGAGLYDIYLIKTDSLGYTAIEENPPSARPEDIAIYAYPNPFNSAVTISVGAGFTPARVEIFDIAGRIVYKMHVGAGSKPARISGGSRTLPYEITWFPDESLGSGVYLVRATVGGISVTRRVAYLK